MDLPVGRGEGNAAFERVFPDSFYDLLNISK